MVRQLWLPHYLGATCGDCGLGLTPDFFRRQLADGRCTVLLDGLDEAADRLARERLSRWIGSAAGTYPGADWW